MNQLNVNLPELPYAVSEAMNRLRINIKFCGKNTRKYERQPSHCPRFFPFLQGRRRALGMGHRAKGQPSGKGIGHTRQIQSPPADKGTKRARGHHKGRRQRRYAAVHACDLNGKRNGRAFGKNGYFMHI